MSKRRPSPALQLSVQFASPQHRALLPRHRLLRWVRAALRLGPPQTACADAGSAPAQITLRFVAAEEGQALNRDYRGKDYATNVLTFDYQPWPAIADIVLCDAVVEREASAQGKLLEAHYAHLVLHGVLHALGWDHENDTDAHAMEAAERSLMAELGYPDPYASEHA